jgi:hypothetical protein
VYGQEPKALQNPDERSVTKSGLMGWEDARLGKQVL